MPRDPNKHRVTNRASRESIASGYTPPPAGYTAKCSSCGKIKPGGEFPVSRDRKSGHHSQCKVCRRAVKKAWDKANPEKKWRPKTKSAARKVRHMVLRKRRKCNMRQATPAWANRDAMAAVYRQALLMRADGIDVHVDHVIPLNHDLVCGLHNEFNLQILTRDDNIAKSNNFVV